LFDSGAARNPFLGGSLAPASAKQQPYPPNTQKQPLPTSKQLATVKETEDGFEDIFN